MSDGSEPLRMNVVQDKLELARDAAETEKRMGE